MLVGAVALTGCSASDPASAPGATAPPRTEDEKLMYFFGAQVSRSLEPYQLTDDEKALVLRGFREALAGEALELDPAIYLPRIGQLAKARQQAVSPEEKEGARAFLAEAAAAEGAQVTDSGLVFVSITEGSGESPTATDTVRIHYHGTLRDGTVFGSTVQRGTPISLVLNRVIPCWTEGVPMMKVGGKATLVCPSEIAYGDRGTGTGIPGGAALKFEVELLEIVDPKAP
jgi:FKBP-type peptidyl-prolyl cis-trans isomerase FkpA